METVVAETPCITSKKKNKKNCEVTYHSRTFGALCFSFHSVIMCRVLYYINGETVVS